MQGLWAQGGIKVRRLRVATLIRRMGIEALYRQPNAPTLASEHKICPCLLRKRPITRPNRVSTMDIAYILMDRGFIYPAAVLD